MTSAQLKVFYAVARHGSFTAAAEHLGLTQPAISDHIKKLEEAYGTALFIRKAKGAQLTEIGAKLFAIAERHAEAEIEAATLLSQAQKLEEGQLIIGADAAVHIMPGIKLFRKNHPAIRIKLLSGNSQNLIARLKDFSIDFAVVAALPEEDSISALRIGAEKMVAIVGQNSSLAKRNSITLAELTKHPIILREEGSVTRSMVLAAFQKAGLALQSSIEVEGREANQELVAQGLGIALVSRGELTPDTRIKSLHLAGCDDTMSEWLLCLKSRANLRLIQAFLAQIKTNTERSRVKTNTVSR